MRGDHLVESANDRRVEAVDMRNYFPINPHGKMPPQKSFKKANPAIFDDEQSLIDNIRQHLTSDDSLTPSDMLGRLGNGQPVQWANGSKISQSSVKKAFREAKQQLDDAVVQLSHAPVAEAPRIPTAKAIQAGGPNFDPNVVCPVECRVFHPEGMRAAVRHQSECAQNCQLEFEDPNSPCEMPDYSPYRTLLLRFTIEAYDGCGVPRSVGGDSFFVAIRGTQRVRARVTDHCNGTYGVLWTPPQSGTYSISVSSFGVALPGSPFIYEATPPLPYAPNCVVTGKALEDAVARATQTFDVEFKDQLGHATQAVDLDVYVDPVPVGSPEVQRPVERKAIVEEEAVSIDIVEQSSRKGSSSKGGESASGRKAKKRGGPDKRQTVQEDVDEEDNLTSLEVETPKQALPSPSELRMTPPGSGRVRRRVVRVKVKNAPLVIRAEENLSSPQIGTVAPGQMMTVVMIKSNRGKVRGMIALDSVSYQAEVVVKKSNDPGGTEDSAESPSNSAAQAEAVKVADATTESRQQVEAKCDQKHGDNSTDAPITDQEESLKQPSSSSSTSDPALQGKVGWVTLVKDGKKFVTSKIRQSTTSRQQHADQWARRIATDRVMPKKAASGDAPAKKELLATPNVSFELKADPSGVGFAFGGVYPGTLHAKGKVVETHKVSYSVGLVGEYLLHVRLRQQATALPGSPFRLRVVPNEAHALSTKLPEGQIVGLVGSEPESGCGVTITTADILGNACITGGAVVTGNPVGTYAEQHVEVTVKDNEDGSYYLHWRSNKSGTYTAAIRVFNEHVIGSPTTIHLNSIAPQLTKTELEGEGLQSGTAGKPSCFRLRFFDVHDNRAAPVPEFKLGLALLQGKSYKDVADSMEFTMTPIDEDKSEQEVTFTPSVDGTFSLHVWAEDPSGKADRKERMPLAGSPFHCVVAPGKPSPEQSFVDGWSKESRAVDKHGKAVEQRPDLIVAGDAVICRPVICDALGNNTVPEEGALDVSITLPDGTSCGLDSPTLKLMVASKGGVTTYDVRHEATRAGMHEVHLTLNGAPIKGSPVRFNVVPALPEVKAAKLIVPTESRYFSNTRCTLTLKTFDRFGNAINQGGLAVATRLQIVKANAHDLTTLVDGNNKVDIEDNDDGTYQVHVTLIKIAATVKVIVNMDKNIPASGGELPAVQLTFELPSVSFKGQDTVTE